MSSKDHKKDKDTSTAVLEEHGSVHDAPAHVAEPFYPQPETFAVIGPGHTTATVTQKISSTVLTKYTPKSWIFGFFIAFCIMQLLLMTITWLLYKGIGIWGVTIPVGWGFDIINFVWWIGIGHAGTLISAILLLLKQDWRTSINRFAEAMTLFAVACAGMYPLLHTGRPWFAYWMLPLPGNTMTLWPQFRSPLIWDVFAVSTYATMSVLFWYVGLVPDLATMRDRAKHRLVKLAYGVGALGWRGSARHWNHYTIAYLILAGLSTPLVISVHSVVSFDFSVSLIPGWHATIFPPYFVAGAIYAGFAMVLTLALPMRQIYGLQDIITMRHIDNMAKVMLATGLIVFYGYILEAFFGIVYSGNGYEKFMIENRWHGPYSWLYWMLILCNGAIPQLLWFKKFRQNLWTLYGVSMVVNVGMWLERFVIIVTSLHRDFLPSSWDEYYPTIFDWSMFAGTIGFFFTLMFLFIRLLPAIPMFEMRELVHHREHTHTEGKGA